MVGSLSVTVEKKTKWQYPEYVFFNNARLFKPDEKIYISPLEAHPYTGTFCNIIYMICCHKKKKRLSCVKFP